MVVRRVVSREVARNVAKLETSAAATLEVLERLARTEPHLAREIALALGATTDPASSRRYHHERAVKVTESELLRTSQPLTKGQV